MYVVGIVVGAVLCLRALVCVVVHCIVIGCCCVGDGFGSSFGCVLVWVLVLEWVGLFWCALVMLRSVLVWCVFVLLGCVGVLWWCVLCCCCVSNVVCVLCCCVRLRFVLRCVWFG